ncbi:hypothetical protein [Chitiniphilus eburneus]|uniref:DUF2946 domain-containing protein n=1 Tax=Chitiniphilus eburneus TaxID=2571148 RepID=A0A4V6WID9_9NEIS|nr:hypothetical protein [Chitiniphilus eburneus]TJZ78968.1 hypothetical protein FAZ21_01390 [Chitiniphilus eburneus]
MPRASSRLALILCLLMACAAVWRGLHGPAGAAPTLSWCVSGSLDTTRPVPLSGIEPPLCPDCLAAQWAGDNAVPRNPPTLFIAPLANPAHIAAAFVALPYFPVQAYARGPPGDVVIA